MPGDVSPSRTQALLSAPGNILWVATDSGLHRRNADGNWDQHLEGEAGLQTPNITALLIRKDGSVWVGAKDGLTWWDGASWHSEKIDGEVPRINALSAGELDAIIRVRPFLDTPKDFQTIFFSRVLHNYRVLLQRGRKFSALIASDGASQEIAKTLQFVHRCSAALRTLGIILGVFFPLA